MTPQNRPLDSLKTLNKVDPYALKTIEHYKGDAFHTYYSDQKRA